MELKILVDDDEARALWETAKKAEVESWPAWEHDDLPHASSDSSLRAESQVAEGAGDRR